MPTILMAPSDRTFCPIRDDWEEGSEGCDRCGVSLCSDEECFICYDNPDPEWRRLRPNLSVQLCDACAAITKTGDIAGIFGLDDLFGSPESLMTALLLAVTEGRDLRAMLLIEKGASITATDQDGYSVLSLAAGWGREDVAALLIEKNALVDASNNDAGRQSIGWTALMNAAKYGHTDTAALLIDKRASIELTDPDGSTALMIAAKHSQVETVRLLIDKRASVDASTPGGWTALMNAALEGHKGVAALLIEKHASIDASDEYGWTALMRTAQYGHTDTAALLVDKRASIELPDPNDWTALMIAARHGHVEAVRLLIDKRASVDASAMMGWTALGSAAHEGHKDVVALLIEKDASIDMADNTHGWTALMRTAKHGKTEVAALLVDKRASIEVSDPDGWTALMIAAKHDQVEAARLLIEAGANLGAANLSGETLMKFANGHNDLTGLLVRKGALVTMLEKQRAARRSSIDFAGRLPPPVLAAQVDMLAPLLQSGDVRVREAALLTLDKVSLTELVTRTKMIARLLSHLDRTYTGVHQPLFACLDPVTPRALIETVAARRDDTKGRVRRAASRFVERRLNPSQIKAAVLVTAFLGPAPGGHGAVAGEAHDSAHYAELAYGSPFHMETTASSSNALETDED